MTPEPATSGSLLVLPMTAMLTTDGVTPFRSGARLGTCPSGPKIGTPAATGAASAAATAKMRANNRGDVVIPAAPLQRRPGLWAPAVRIQQTRTLLCGNTQSSDLTVC